MSKTNSMPQVGELYESPIINEPYDAPKLHLALRHPPPVDNRYEVKKGRRSPGLVREDDPKPLSEIEPYSTISEIRKRVDDWRANGYPNVDGKTAHLLDHWQNQGSERRLFFCQREAVETLIWLHVYQGRNQVCDEIHTRLTDWNEMFNEGLPRISTKMATGTGKTVVIAMLMLWMAVRSRNPINNFLVITPGTVVTERLKEGLSSSSKNNVFVEHQLWPPDLPEPSLNITIVHRHLLEPRSGIGNSVGGKPPDRASAAILATQAQAKAEESGGTVVSANETISEMMDGYLGPLPDNTPLCIINDEAHHCYAENGERRKWLDAILRIRDKSRFDVAAVHDFSATPIWRDPPTNAPGEVFPWTVSDFPLIEAVESGLTKIPRLPTDTNVEEWKHGRRIYGEVGPTELPGTVTPDVSRYLELLVHHHLKKTRPAYQRSGHNPILCVVADTIENAEAFFRYIAGHWDKDDPAKIECGRWDDFSNIEMDPKGKPRIKENPPTLLVHSEVGRGIGAEDGEIGVADNVDLWAFFGDESAGKKGRNKWLAGRIRKLFSTAGRKGEAGEGIRCIISVSMLTEGWDCRTVTEIFGFRAFKSELLVEQVTGRALRRTEYALDDDTGRFPEQHANLIGVPFSWVPEGGTKSREKNQIQPYECRVVEGRDHLEIRMPRVERYEIVPEHISLELDPAKVTSHQIEILEKPDEIVVSFEGGLQEKLTLEEVHMPRDRAIWKIAAVATTRLIESDKAHIIRERLPIMRDLLVAARKWWMHSESKAEGLEKVMAFDKVADKCADALILSCIKKPHKAWIRPHLFSNDEWATSAKPYTFLTRLQHRYPDPIVDGRGQLETRLSQRNVAPCHSTTEERIARVLDKSNVVDAWVRNDERLRFSIPYRGSHGFLLRYIPDFVARSKARNYLVIEYKGDWGGKSDVHEDSKRHYAETHWCPAVNADKKIQEETGRWGFLWIDNDHDIQEKIEKALAKLDAELYSKPANPKEAA